MKNSVDGLIETARHRQHIETVGRSGDDGQSGDAMEPKEVNISRLEKVSDREEAAAAEAAAASRREVLVRIMAGIEADDVEEAKHRGSDMKSGDDVTLVLTLTLTVIETSRKRHGEW